MKKRILSIFTVLALCLTLPPVSALADDGVSYVDKDGNPQPSVTATTVESNTTEWNNDGCT
jgi:hypothetical protein